MKGSVLIVEDSLMINKIIKKRLDSEFEIVEQAFTLNEALEKIEKDSFNFIILDLHLPDGEGLDLITELKSLNQTKIVVLTSLNDDLLREELFRYGVLDYVIKDSNLLYSIDEILKVLKNIEKNRENKILVIDDSRFVCRQIKKLLEPRNYKIFTASNCSEAVKILEKESFNLIILDIELPDKSGNELLRELRGSRFNLKIPIIALSGRAESYDVRDFLKSGANDYLKKPFVFEEFVLIIDLWIDYSRNQNKIKELTQNLKDRVAEELENSRKKDELLLLQSRHTQMGEMIAMIAHQWRQPLNYLGTSLTSMEIKLSRNDVQKDDILKLLDRSKEYIQYMSDTINDFRNYFSPKKITKKTDFKKIVKKALNILKSLIKQEGIEIDILVKDVKGLDTYENELVQVVLNIVKNGIDELVKREIEEPKIELKIDGAILSIKDNAGGIDKDILPKIFDPYFSTKSKNGTGLGLYMSKIIVENSCNGRLIVENIDKGAKFTIDLT